MKAAGRSPGTGNFTSFVTRLLQNKFDVLDYSTLFVLTCHVLTDNMENWFELAGGSSYRGFELPRVKLQLMYDGNLVEIDFGSSKREVRVSEGSSYRESIAY